MRGKEVLAAVDGEEQIFICVKTVLHYIFIDMMMLVRYAFFENEEEGVCAHTIGHLHFF